MAQRPPDEPSKAMPGEDADTFDFRWTAFFQRSTEPLFVLNRRRQILFVNRAWQSLTGITGRDVLKRVCKRRRDAEPGSCEAVLNVLSPSREAMEGRIVRVRRLFVQPQSRPRWWDIDFFPLSGSKGLLGIVGRIHAVSIEQPTTAQPLPEKLTALRQRSIASFGLQNLPTNVPTMSRIAEQVRLASQTAASALLVGEPGTGKEWLARTIHQESKNREQGFVALDCRHLPMAALAWSLFGPPALARRGGMTLYLQEAYWLPRELQSRLCEHFAAAEEGRAPRLLAGTSAEAAQEIQAGRLLEEFYCVLSPVKIEVPPLRQRIADLPWLTERFLARASNGRDSEIKRLSAEAWELIHAYPWPGNLNELYAVLAGACRRAEGDAIEAADLPWFLRSSPPLPERTLPLDKILEQVERRLVQWAVAAARGNKSKAAELLGVLRPRLLRRIDALGIDNQ